MTDYEIDIREIKEDLKEIKGTLTKMQEDIKRIENNVPFYPTTYQYSPDCYNTVPPTQACSYEEMVSKIEPKINWLAEAEWDEEKQKFVVINNL